MFILLSVHPSYEFIHDFAHYRSENDPKLIIQSPIQISLSRILNISIWSSQCRLISTVFAGEVFITKAGDPALFQSVSDLLIVVMNHHSEYYDIRMKLSRTRLRNIPRWHHKAISS